MSATDHIARPAGLARRPDQHGVETWPGATRCPHCGAPLVVMLRWEYRRQGTDRRNPEQREHRACEPCGFWSWGPRR